MIIVAIHCQDEKKFMQEKIAISSKKAGLLGVKDKIKAAFAENATSLNAVDIQLYSYALVRVIW